MLQFLKVIKEERQSTMKAVYPMRGLTQNFACLLNIRCSVKEEELCVSTLGVKFIPFLLKHFSNAGGIILSTLRHVICTIANGHNNRTGITTHNHHIEQMHALNGSTIIKPTQPKCWSLSYYDSPVALVCVFKMSILRFTCIQENNLVSLYVKKE